MVCEASAPKGLPPPDGVRGYRTLRSRDLPHPKARSSIDAPTWSNHADRHTQDTSTTEVHQAATRSLDEKGMTIHPKFHRFRYVTQDPYRTPWARRPQGEDIEEECGSTVRCMNHGACRHTQPFNHSHAHCVLVAASTPTGPQPTRVKDSIEDRRKQ
ncbi:hypothetical protein V6N13_116921 [Hibiscus sabdariffa]